MDSGLSIFTTVSRSHISKFILLTGLTHLIETALKEELVYLTVLSLVILRPNCKVKNSVDF